MRKVIMLGAVLSAVLVGCGVPNRVAEEAKNIDVGFISTEAEVGSFLFHHDRDEVEKTKIESACSEEKRQQIQKMIQCLKSLEEKKVISTECVDSREFNEGISLNDIENYFSIDMAWKEEDTLYDRYYIHVDIEKKEQRGVFFEEMEKLGYTGLNLWDKKKDNETVYTISRGIVFEQTTCEGESSISIAIYKSNLFAKTTFVDLIKSCLRDGFSVREQLDEGYLQRLTLVGGYRYTELGEYWPSTEIYIYLKQQKFLQMEICIGSRPDETIFADNEKETVINLLSWASGDAKASAKFVSELSLQGEKHGTLGNCKWYIIQNTESGDNILRIMKK